ncbi:MAG TPA: helix-turn-helix domain-containing protein, partial [Chitinophagaceae bacterium]|nr:helix-turn-helix domain-containing protein [Chitinophagaceae bacterium]
ICFMYNLNPEQKLSGKQSDVLKRQYLELGEAARFLKISRSTIQKISAARLIPVYKPNNGKVYFLHEDLVKHIEAGRRKLWDEITAEGLGRVTNSKIKKNETWKRN